MRAALRLAFIYALFFGIYLGVSGWLVRGMSSDDPDILKLWQGLRGFAALGASTILVFILSWFFAVSRARIERRLSTEKASLQRLFDQSPLPAWVYDAENLQILAVNEAVLTDYGYTRRDILRSPVTVLHPLSDQEELTTFLRRLKPALRYSRWKHMRRDGSEFPVEIVSRPVTFDGRDARMAFGRDLSEDKRVEHVVAETQSLKGDAEKIHWHALAAISREMRKSLETAETSLASLLSTLTDEEQKTIVAGAAKGVGECLSLAGQTIIAANKGARVRPRDGREIELEPFLRRIQDEFFDAGERSGLKLNVEIPPATPSRALVNSRWLKQALEVCMGDALKYAQGVTVTLKARMESTAGHPACLEIVVSENEPLGQSRYVFEAPNLLPMGDSRKHFGSAMGLFVLRQICDLMSASLRVGATRDGSEIAIRLSGVVDEKGVFVADGSQVPPVPPELAALMA